VLADAGLAFTAQPVSQFGSVGGILTNGCAVTGDGPLTFQWYFTNQAAGLVTLSDGSSVTGLGGSDVSVVSGSQTPLLTVTKVNTNITGDFYVVVTTTAPVSPNSIQSTNAHITVNPPTAVSIAFLRNLEDKTTWQATDVGTVYVISNATVISFTNVTGSAT